MIGDIKTLDDFNVKGKTVLLRVDINCPVEKTTKKIKDDTRIRRSIGTIKELTKGGAKLVILAHQADPLDYQNFTMLGEHSEILSHLLEREVEYIEDAAGPYALQRIQNLKEGQILLLENIRIYTEETIIFEKEVKLSPIEQTETFLVRKLAPLADIYICDAFAAVHRSEPSLVGFPQILPSGCGRLFEEELRALSQLRDNPKRPCIFILGGAKILDAFKMMKKSLEAGIADRVLTHGLVGEIMLMAKGVNLGEETTRLICNRRLNEFIPIAERILNRFPSQAIYPQDVAISHGERREEIEISSLPVEELIIDIGEKTIHTYEKIIEKAGTIFLNGPAGIYEREISSKGTRRLWKKIAEGSAFSVIGGGDTIAASKRFGVVEKFSYVSTAGGGLIRFLSGEKLPVIESLSFMK